MPGVQAILEVRDLADPNMFKLVVFLLLVVVWRDCPGIGTDAHRHVMSGDQPAISAHHRNSVRGLLSSDQWIGEHLVDRVRRQAASRQSGAVLQTLRVITELLQVRHRRDCVTVYNSLFSNCSAYAGELVANLFTVPLTSTLQAYQTIAQSVCPSLTPTSCSSSAIDCFLLANTLQAAAPLLAGAGVSGTASDTVNGLCNGAQGSSSTGQLIALIQTLNRAVNLTTVFIPALCPTIASTTAPGPALRSQLRVISSESFKLANSAGLLTALSNPAYSVLLRKVLIELPQRLQNTLRNLSSSRLQATFDSSYVSNANNYLLCASMFPVDGIKPCPWLCQNVSGMLDLRGRFWKANNQSLPSSSGDTILQLFEELSVQCYAYGSWDYCLDPACGVSTEVCMNGSRAAAVAKHSGEGPCFTPACPFPLHRTAVVSHFDSDVQAILRAGYHATLILVDNTTQFNPSVLPCGVKCITVTFTEDDEETMRIIIGVFGWLLFVVSLFALLTFYLNRERINKYPTKVLLFLNLTSAIGNFANLIQFFVDKKTYACYEDGTLRVGEPTDSDNGSRTCTLLFVLIFYNLLASLCWWLALTHAWYVTFERLDMSQGHPEDNNYLMKYYHIVAWPVPAVFTAVMLGNRFVDGFPLYGICYTINVDAWFNYLSIPIVVAGVLGLPFLVLGIRKLIHHRRHIDKMSHVRRRPSQMKFRTNSSLRNFMMKLAFIIVMSFINLQVR